MTREKIRMVFLTTFFSTLFVILLFLVVLCFGGHIKRFLVTVFRNPRDLRATWSGGKGGTVPRQLHERQLQLQCETRGLVIEARCLWVSVPVRIWPRGGDMLELENPWTAMYDETKALHYEARTLLRKLTSVEARALIDVQPDTSAAQARAGVIARALHKHQRRIKARQETQALCLDMRALRHEMGALRRRVEALVRASREDQWQSPHEALQDVRALRRELEARQSRIGTSGGAV